MKVNWFLKYSGFVRLSQEREELWRCEGVMNKFLRRTYQVENKNRFQFRMA